MRTRARILTLIAALPVALGIVAPTALAGGYPVDCEKEMVVLVPENGTAPQGLEQPSINAAIIAAKGNPTGAGDTVIVCPGTYEENVSIPLTDINGPNDNISVRSWDGPHDTTIVGDLSAEDANGDPIDAIVDIDANGVVFGGAGLGFTIEGTQTPLNDIPAGASKAGIQVGSPLDPDLEQDDDQEIPPAGGDPDGTNCLSDPTTDSGECTDQELPAQTPINVSVMGNEINELVPSPYAGTLAGIAVNNSNNTLVFRNLINKVSVDGSAIAYGIRYSDTNSHVEVLQNAVKELTQTGGDCVDSTLAKPTQGAIGIAAQEEALDALFFNNKVEKIEANCQAIGAYSDAWGQLENDRNGQQIPIVTDIVNNELREIEGGEASAIVLAPEAQYRDGNTPTDDDEQVAPPSSFRVMVNDIDKTGTGVSVLTELAAYSYIEQNNFDHNMVGIDNDAASRVDGTNNWWGCQEGPDSGKAGCATVEGNVAFHPWTKKHIDHAGAHAGDHAGDH